MEVMPDWANYSDRVFVDRSNRRMVALDNSDVRLSNWFAFVSFYCTNRRKSQIKWPLNRTSENIQSRLLYKSRIFLFFLSYLNVVWLFKPDINTALYFKYVKLTLEYCSYSCLDTGSLMYRSSTSDFRMFRNKIDLFWSTLECFEWRCIRPCSWGIFLYMRIDLADNWLSGSNNDCNTNHNNN